MDQNSLDQIIKASLFDHKTALDKDALWAAIDGRKKRRTTWLSVLSTIGLLLILGSGAMFFSNDKNEAIEDNSTSLSSIVVSDGTTIMEDKSIFTAENSIARSTSAKTLVKINKKERSVQQDHVSKPSIVSKSITTQKTYNQNKAIQYQTSQLKKDQRKEQETAVLKNSNESDIINTPINNQINSSKEAAPTFSFPLKVKQKNLNNNLIDRRAIENLSLVKSLPATVVTSGFERNILRNNKVKCYDHRRKINPLYAEIYSSVDYVFNRRETDQENLNYMQQRDSTQTQLEGYRAGLRFKWLTRSGMYIKVGLEVGNIKERFDLTKTETRTEVWPNQLLDKIMQGDSTIFIYGDAPVTIIDETTWKIWNSYRTVGIPILVGYQRDINKFTYGIEMGGIYNLYYDFKGTLLNPQLEPSNNNDFIGPSKLASITGGISIGYQVKPKIKLQAFSSFKYNVSNINNDNDPVKQSNTRVGLGLALEYQL